MIRYNKAMDDFEKFEKAMLSQEQKEVLAGMMARVPPGQWNSAKEADVIRAVAREESGPVSSARLAELSRIVVAARQANFRD